MRLAWLSNSQFASTGYGVQTLHVLPRLQALGHQMAVMSNYGLEAGCLPWQTPHGVIPCYPKGWEPSCLDVAPQHAEHFGAEAMIVHYDAWTIDPSRMRHPYVPWFPVDTDELSPAVKLSVERAALRITQTRHGQGVVEAAGLDCEYVPAAYSAAEYAPRPEDAAMLRESLGAEDRFLVGVVAANRANRKLSRKCFPQILEAFSLFLKREPSALLYLHTWPGEEQDGVNIAELAAGYGVPTEAVRLPDLYALRLGYPARTMSVFYSAFDVLLNPSMGEGFGVPIVEAQACGTPVITGGWTAMPEITRSGACVAREDAYRFRISGYGDQFLPNPAAIADLLTESVGWDYAPADVASRVAEYEIERVVAEHWVPALAKLEERVAPAAVGPNRAQRRKMKVAKQAAVA